MRNLLVFVSLLVPVALAAQDRTPTQQAAQDAYLAKVNSLQRQAKKIAEAELKRKPAVGCEIDNKAGCSDQEEVASAKAYGEVVRLLGESFALPDPDSTASFPPTTVKNFQAAEIDWQSYRTHTCAAMGDAVLGGAVRARMESECRVSMTHAHLQEIDDNFLGD